MKRISTDIEYLNDGKVTIDADGIPVNLGYRGTGSPEDKIAAPVGSVYTDTAATNGAIRWIKAIGTGSKGWRVEYGDTGWRDITSLLSTPPTSGSAWIRRTPDFVLLRLLYLNQADKSSTSISLATGFFPGVCTAGALFDAGGNQAGHYTMTFGGTLTLHTTTGPLDSMVSIAVTPDRPWPSTYIGTPA